MMQTPAGDDRPVPLKPNIAAVPLSLRALKQWVLWKYEKREGKWTKVPVNARTGGNALATDWGTWSSFEDAVASLAGRPGLAGLGFVFAADGNLCGIDLDDCIDANGTMSEGARAIVEEFNSYTEVSPSGRGAKIIVEARKPAGAKCRLESPPGSGCSRVEVYDRARFFTVTGRTVEGTPPDPQPRQAQVEALCARLWPPAPLLTPVARIEEWHDATDDELIDRAKKAANGRKFKRLWEGDTSGHGGDDSRADLALCSMLAYWTSGEAERIDRLFRRSGLYRPKWERPNYREATIRKAMEEVVPEETPSGGGGEDDDGTSVDPGARAPRRHCTDLGNAERLAAHDIDNLRFCHTTGQWLVWDGRRWAVDERGTAIRQAGVVVREMLKEAAGLGNKKARARLAKWAIASEARGRLEAMAALARSLPGIAVAASELDQDNWLLNVQNGTIDLRTGECGPHRRDDLITIAAPTEYIPSADCPLFEKFLGRIFGGDAEIQSFVQRYLGAALTGDVRDQVLPIFYGVGANGKSVLIDTICGLLGGYAAQAPPRLLVESRNSEHPTEIADLRGRRLVIASETEEGAVLKLQLIKRLTGDKTLKGRFMRMDYFEFERTHKLVLVTNNRPRIREDSEAAWRRLRLVPFDVVIPAAERDPHLLAKLEQERPGILNWLIRGCREWQEVGLGGAEAVSRATNLYRESEDQLARFVEDRCVTEDVAGGSVGITVPWAMLLAAYEDWAVQNEEHAMAAAEFRAALEKRGYVSDTQRVGGKPTKVRLHIGLRDDTRLEGIPV